MSADGIQHRETGMGTGKVLTFASMAALLIAPASFAGQPAFAGEKLSYVGDGDARVDYTAEFAAASVPGQPASAR
jgi:hypothetical protein